MAQHYDLFFSYRHKPLDTEITEKCFQFVEKFRMPENLKKQGYEGVRRAFRDKEELSVSRILTETIDSALRSAEHLVIVCTKQTPQSEWVDREIQIFIELGKAGNIYPLLVEGTPEEAFTPSLRKIPDIMERVMDVRSAGNDVKAIMTKAQKELVRVIAAVSGCEEELLRRELKITKKRQTAVRAISAMILFVCVGAVSALLCNIAIYMQDKAQQQEAAAELVLKELTYSLPDELYDHLDLFNEKALDTILKEFRTNIDEYEKIISKSSDVSKIETEIAANHAKRTTVYLKFKALDEAIISAKENVGIVYRLRLENKADNSALASAYGNMAQVYTEKGDYYRTLNYYKAAISLQETVPDEKGKLVIFYSGKAVAQANINHLSEALLSIEKAIELLQDKKTEISVPEEIDILYRYGQLLLSSNMEDKAVYSKAEKALQEAAKLSEQTYEDKKSATKLQQLIYINNKLAYCYLAEGKYNEAEKLYRQMIPKAEELARNSRIVDYIIFYAELLNSYGLLENYIGDFERADQLYREGAALYGEIAEKMKTVESRSTYAETLANVACNAIMHGNREEAEQYFSMSFAEFSAMEDELSNYYKGLYYGYRSYKKIMLDHDFIGACADGEKATEAFESIFTYTCAAYAYMFAGQHEICDSYFGSLATTGEGTIQSILTDFDAMERNGVSCDHMQHVREKILLAQ